MPIGGFTIYPLFFSYLSYKFSLPIVQVFTTYRTNFYYLSDLFLCLSQFAKKRAIAGMYLYAIVF